MSKETQEQLDTTHTQPLTPQIPCNILLNLIIVLILIGVKLNYKNNFPQ